MPVSYTHLDVYKRQELVIDGIDTNQELQYLILHTGEYVKGNFDTSFIENNLDKLVG